MQKIMIIRHAEKHQHGRPDHGVTEEGVPARHELTVRGWQRAAALVHFFAAAGPGAAGSPIEPPRVIFASDATRQSPSLRAMHTVGPLAAALGVPVIHNFAEGDESRLAAAALAAPSPILIAWHHGAITRLAHRIAGEQIGCPAEWPDERFDLVWLLTRARPDHAWHFSQIPQCLLPGDRPETI